MRFNFLTGDVNWETYGGKWVSKRLSNGQFAYWLVLEFVNWEDAVGDLEAKEIGSKYHIELSSVSPSEAGEDNLAAAFRCCGLDQEDQSEIRSKSLVQVEALHSYGLRAPLWDADGNNIKALFRLAHAQANKIVAEYDDALETEVNKIGSTAAEFQRGELNNALFRDPLTFEKRIILKMHGAKDSELVAYDKLPKH